MATTNEKLRDELVEYQVYLLRLAKRYSNGLNKSIDKTIPSTLEAINRTLERIEDMGGYVPNQAVTRELRELRKEVKGIRGSVIKMEEDIFYDDMVTLSRRTPLYTTRLINASLPAGYTVNKLISIPQAQATKNIVTFEQFNGRTLRQWFNSLSENDVNRIMTTVTDGLRNGLSNQEIARQIRGSRKTGYTDGILQTTRRGAEAITRTVTNGVTNSSRTLFAVQNKDIIVAEVYVATLDKRTTAICRSLDGERFAPGEGAIPPLHVNCRSTRVPVIDANITLIGTRPYKAEDIGSVPASTDYETWLKTRSAEFQNEVLGYTRAVEFRAGRLSLDSMVDKSGKLITLKELGLSIKRQTKR